MERPLAGPPFEDDQAPLLSRSKELGVHPGRKHEVVAGQALVRGLGGRLRGRDERVDPSEQPLALCPPRRVAEPLGREKGRDGERARIAQSQVREARQPGLEAMDDVVAALGEREREVRPRADRHADAAPARDRHRRPESDDLVAAPVEQRAPASDQVGRARRGGEHRHRVPEGAQPIRDPRHVLVDVVGA